MATTHSTRLRLIGALVVGAVIAGCSAGGAAPSTSTASDGGPAASDGGEPPGSSPVGVPEGQRPSGAQARVVNVYSPVTGDPGPIDVYAAPWVEAGAKPLISVPYGGVSPLFDPTVADDQGDMFLSFYSQGVTGNGSELISQTETLKGGEVITFYVGTGSLLDSGRYGGAIGVLFAKPSGGTFGQPTAPPGKALVAISSVGLDHIVKNPEASDWYVSVGHGCTGGISDEPDSLAIVRPGTAGTFALDPGQGAVSIHAYDATIGGIPDCSNTALLSAPITATAGETYLMLIYAPKDGDLRTLVVPLAP